MYTISGIRPDKHDHALRAIHARCPCAFLTAFDIVSILSGCHAHEPTFSAASVTAARLGHDGGVAADPIERIKKDADLSTSKGRVVEAGKQIQSGYGRATWVVLGTVTNDRSTVQAVPDGGVAYPQGWASWSVRVDEVIKGRLDDKSIEVVVFGGCAPSSIDPSVFSCHMSLVNGDRYYLFLTKEESLSRWCGTNVYQRELGVPLRGRGGGP